METDKETITGDGLTQDQAVLVIEAQDAKGTLKLIRNMNGADLILDGRVLAHVDLYYRSPVGGDDDAVKKDCVVLELGVGDDCSLLSVCIHQPETGDARMTLLRSGGTRCGLKLWDNIPDAAYWDTYTPPET